MWAFACLAEGVISTSIIPLLVGCLVGAIAGTFWGLVALGDLLLLEVTVEGAGAVAEYLVHKCRGVGLTRGGVRAGPMLDTREVVGQRLARKMVWRRISSIEYGVLPALIEQGFLDDEHGSSEARTTRQAPRSCLWQFFTWLCCSGGSLELFLCFCFPAALDSTVRLLQRVIGVPVLLASLPRLAFAGFLCCAMRHGRIHFAHIGMPTLVPDRGAHGLPVVRSLRTEERERVSRLRQMRTVYPAI